MLRKLVWKYTYWPCDLDLWPFSPKTTSLLWYPKIIPYSKFEHFEIIHFRVTSYAPDKQTNIHTDRQTDRQTDPNVLPTLTNRDRRG